jgi:hypothetical protein
VFVDGHHSSWSAMSSPGSWWPWRDQSLDDVFGDTGYVVWVGPAESYGRHIRVLVCDSFDPEGEVQPWPVDLTVAEARHLRDALDRALRTAEQQPH